MTNMLKRGIVFLLFLLLFSFVGASVESDFYNLVNNERNSLGRTSLVNNANLETAGYLHAQDMSVQNYFSHTSKDGRTFVTRIKNAGYTGYNALGENIAYHSGAPSASKVFSMWKGSSGHYSNMISTNFNEQGLGYYYDGTYTYYVQDLGRRSGVIINPNNNTVPVTNTSVPPINNNTGSGTNSSNTGNNSSSSGNNSSGGSTVTPGSGNTNYSELVVNFTIDQSNYTKYKKISVKANINQMSKVQSTFMGSSSRICTKCNRFFKSLKVYGNSSNEMVFYVNGSYGQNKTYRFIL